MKDKHFHTDREVPIHKKENLSVISLHGFFAYDSILYLVSSSEES